VSIRSQSGVTFAIELLAQNDINPNVQEALAIGDHWTEVGSDAVNNFVSGRTDWQQAASKLPGLHLRHRPGVRGSSAGPLREITSESNRWRGRNFGGYGSPASDQLVDRLYTSFNVSERGQIAADVVKIWLDQTLYLPVTLGSDVAAVRKGAQGCRRRPVAAYHRVECSRLDGELGNSAVKRTAFFARSNLRACRP
jgi:hypothetical protein